MKYKLTAETKFHNGRTLYRIQSLSNFNDVKVRDKGGWIENESNLSQYGNAWIYDNAIVYDNAKVYGNARVYGNAIVHGNAHVYGNAEILSDSIINGHIEVYAK